MLKGRVGTVKSWTFHKRRPLRIGRRQLPVLLGQKSRSILGVIIDFELTFLRVLKSDSARMKNIWNACDRVRLVFQEMKFNRIARNGESAG